MKTKVWFFSRIFLGLTFLVFGLNGFFNFMPPQPMPDAAMTFIGGLFSAPYFLFLLKGTEVIAGFCLFAGWYAPLSLMVLAPITLNIFMFHMFLAPAGLVVALPLTAFHIVCGWSYWPMFKGFFNKTCAYDCTHKTTGGHAHHQHGFKKSA